MFASRKHSRKDAQFAFAHFTLAYQKHTNLMSNRKLTLEDFEHLYERPPTEQQKKHQQTENKQLLILELHKHPHLHNINTTNNPSFIWVSFTYA